MTEDPSRELRPEIAGIDITVPVSARIWNYWMGGIHYYPVDKQAGDAYAKVYPGVFNLARASRDFIVRAVAYLAGEAGVRQFLDIGTGIPSHDNTHEVALRVDHLKAALPAGGYLASYEGTDEDPVGVEAERQYEQSGAVPYRLRRPEQVRRFFDGLELVEPGVVPIQQWRPGANPYGEVPSWGGVGRSPGG